MAKKPKKYEDDDGRVIADMSGISRPSMFLPHLSDTRASHQPAPSQEEGQQEERPWEDTGMSREDRRAYIWGALRAALLLAAVYIVGLVLLILFLLWLWN